MGMHEPIEQVAVIGAGTMGAGIAGQLANAGVAVLLLDIPADGDNPNALAERGLSRLSNPGSPGLMDAAAAARITLGNTRDDLHRVVGCDWVAEAIVEQLDVKQALYSRIANHLSPEAMLSSNTSTIPIWLLTEGMNEAIKARFAITHFFNPVRFMRLLELVRGERTRDDVMQRLGDFCEERLGKGVVPCVDTPGFLANRVGCFAIQCALHEALQAGIDIEMADALFGRPMGIPKTGVFGLYDLIGIDLMADVAISLTSTLPADDAFHTVGQTPPAVQSMIARGQCGNKSRQGFYRSSEKGERQVLDLHSQSYQPVTRPVIDIALQAEQQGVRTLIEHDSEHGRYAWRVLSQTLAYAASLIPTVTGDPVDIDDAMKLGYNWVAGPFELIDEIGVDYLVTRLQNEGQEVPWFLQALLAGGTASAPPVEAGQWAGESPGVVSPDIQPQIYRTQDGLLERRCAGAGAEAEAGAGAGAGAAATRASSPLSWQPLQRSPGVHRFSEIRRTLEPQGRNASASWYAWQDVALVEFHSKANALDGDSMVIVADALNGVPNLGLAGLVLHSDASHFSCGVNLAVVRDYYRARDWTGLDRFLAHFQQTVHALSVAPFPVVAAPVGLSIGGGFEVVLHAQKVILHANSVTGLVESGVGLIPAGGGCKETLYRWQEKLQLPVDKLADAAWKAFMNLGYGVTASAPSEAREQAMLRSEDSWVMNRDHSLQAALDWVAQGQVLHGSRPTLHMPGRPVYAAMTQWLDARQEQGKLLPHDTVVGRAVAGIVTGGAIEVGTLWTEQDLFDAERRAFVELAASEATQARVDGMLDSGARVRN